MEETFVTEYYFGSNHSDKPPQPTTIQDLVNTAWLKLRQYWTRYCKLNQD